MIQPWSRAELGPRRSPAPRAGASRPRRPGPAPRARARASSSSSRAELTSCSPTVSIASQRRPARPRPASLCRSRTSASWRWLSQSAPRSSSGFRRRIASRKSRSALGAVALLLGGPGERVERASEHPGVADLGEEHRAPPRAAARRRRARRGRGASQPSERSACARATMLPLSSASSRPRRRRPPAPRRAGAAGGRRWPARSAACALEVLPLEAAGRSRAPPRRHAPRGEVADPPGDRGRGPRAP